MVDCCPGSSKRGALSAADGGHRAGGLQEAGIVDAVPGQFGGDGAAPDGGQLAVVGSGPKRRAQITLVAGEQAVADLAVGGQPDPVACPQNGLVTDPITPTRSGPPSTRKVSAGADPRPAGSAGVSENSADRAARISPAPM
jgi:hypothetical protein